MNTNNKNLSEKKVYVACDFSLPLRMFNLPEIYANKIKQAFPNINIIFIPKEINKLSSLNIKALENVTIYWGNLFSPKMLKIMPKLEWIHFGSVGVEKAKVEREEISRQRSSRRETLRKTSTGKSVTPSGTPKFRDAWEAYQYHKSQTAKK